MLDSYRVVSITLAILSLTACASAPHWQHTVITDQVIAARQLIVDDGNCTLVANGAAPVPQVPTSNYGKTTNISLQGTTYNTATGTRSYNTYAGQATTGPSGGFAGGFASGLESGANLGAAIAARMSQDRIHKSCMYSKGWTDATTGTSQDDGFKKAAYAGTPPPARSPVAPKEIYTSAQEEWKADTAEFFQFYPLYRSGSYFASLNEKVIALAKSKDMTGPEYLLAALNVLQDEGKQAPEPIADDDGLRMTYHKAIAGDTRSQDKLSVTYVNGNDARIPINFSRAAFWARKSALAGSPVGQLGYGILLFRGEGMSVDRINGYLWVKKSAQSSLDVSSTLRRFEGEMSAAELQAVK